MRPRGIRGLWRWFRHHPRPTGAGRAGGHRAGQAAEKQDVRRHRGYRGAESPAGVSKLFQANHRPEPGRLLALTSLTR